ncbi:MAG: S-layer homology domain-containing protein, partial [Clostridia bacterium]|nr:S-layer homology domain-containing protein [Clostridia bacterium]
MKKILSLIIVCMMVFGVLSVTANAEIENPFTDVKSGKWYYDAVMEAYELGIMKGTSDTEFKPLGNMTRAQVVTLLARLAGEEVTGCAPYASFKDVKPNQWYADAVGWAVNRGLAGGYDDRTFKPNNPVNRQELAKLIMGLVSYMNVNLPENPKTDKFADASKIPAWAKEYVEAMRVAGIVAGDNMGNFNPKNTATRAEVSTIGVRLVPLLNPTVTAQYLLDKFLNNACGAHNGYHVYCGYSADFTAENFNKWIKTWIGADEFGDKFSVEVDADVIDENRGDYQNEGTGSSIWMELPFAVIDNETGERVETEEVGFRVKKYPDAAGDMSICPDDGQLKSYIASLDSLLELDDAGRIRLWFQTGSSVTYENFSNQIISALGLSP